MVINLANKSMLPKLTEEPKGKVKILLAEDDHFLIQLISTKLKRKGFAVSLAYNGTEALNKIKNEPFDLILLDLIMPNKDGFEVLAEAKASPKLKAIPILVFSNLGQDSDIKQAKDLGADDYMVKANLSIDEVVRKVDFCLANKKIKTQIK